MGQPGRPPKQPIYDPDAGKRIAMASLTPRRPKDDDGHPSPHLNALEAKRVAAARVNLQIPIIDTQLTLRVLKFLEDEIPALRTALRALPDGPMRRSLAQSTLSKWNQEFSRSCGVSSAPKMRRRKRTRQTQIQHGVVSGP